VIEVEKLAITQNTENLFRKVYGSLMIFKQKKGTLF